MDLDAIVVSNDQYIYLKSINFMLKRYIDDNLLMYTFVDDIIMFPEDPKGRYGPRLKEYLSYK